MRIQNWNWIWKAWTGDGLGRMGGRDITEMGNWFEDEEFDMSAIEARHMEMEAEAQLEAEAEQQLRLEKALKEGEEEEPGGGSYPESDWEAIVEAVLFTMGQSVELRQLAIAIGQSEKVARRVVENLQKRYETENRGMQILELDHAFQMGTKARFYDNLIRVASAPKKHVLTDVVLETLSIIAYKQPVTKMEISRIRGVSSDHAVNRLVECPRKARIVRHNRRIPAAFWDRFHGRSAQHEPGAGGGDHPGGGRRITDEAGGAFGGGGRG